MKMVDLKKHPDAANSVRKEVCIQKMLQDTHILRFFGKRSQGSVEYIFLEYAAGGELFDRIGECGYLYLDLYLIYVRFMSREMERKYVFGNKFHFRIKIYQI